LSSRKCLLPRRDERGDRAFNIFLGRRIGTDADPNGRIFIPDGRSTPAFPGPLQMCEGGLRKVGVSARHKDLVEHDFILDRESFALKTMRKQLRQSE
jgi:hypothetical protein